MFKALKFKVKSKDEVPAELRNLYVERDGSFLLDVDGALDKVTLLKRSSFVNLVMGLFHHNLSANYELHHHL
jgi:hypothetical protein